MGRIRSHVAGKFEKGMKGGQPYGEPRLMAIQRSARREHIKISRAWGNNLDLDVAKAVAEAFIPNPENHPVVLHLDNDPFNNRVENLAWGEIPEGWQPAARVLQRMFKCGTWTPQSI